ncbi:MAG: hypothetical protein WAN59_14205 [Candidatus Baltobacteraceae bacterium]
MIGVGVGRDAGRPQTRERPELAASAVAWASALGLAVAVAFSFVTANPNLPHVALTLWLGRRLLGGAPADLLGRLGGVVAALVERAGGEPALALATAFAALAAFALIAVRASRVAGNVAGFAAAALAVLCSLDLLRPGGGMTNLAFAAALMLALDARTLLGAGLAALLAVVWCNAAPEGLLAAPLAAAWAFGSTLEGARGARLREAWLGAAGCALATLATPAGAAFPKLAYEALRLDRDLVALVPVHPVDVAPAAYRVGFTLVVLGALAFGARLRRAELPPLGFALLLALANGAFLPLLGAVAGPALACAARLPRAFCVALVSAAACAAVGVSLETDRANAGQPYELVAQLAADGTSHRLFCEPLEWCSVATAAAAPGLRPFMDGRVAEDPPALRKMQRAIGRVNAGWRAEVSRARIDTFLVTRNEALATLLGLDPHWRRIASDERALVFVRAGGTKR